MCLQKGSLKYKDVAVKFVKLCRLDRDIMFPRARPHPRIDGLERENILKHIYFTSGIFVLVLNVYLNLNMLDL